MNKISVLAEGYAREWESNGWEASSSVVLAEAGKLKILCDPGINSNLLQFGFENKKLKYSDIDLIFLTNTQLDHSHGIIYFPFTNIIDYKYIYSADKCGQHYGKISDTDLEIISTPGPSFNSASLVVPVGNKTYVVAGDVFRWAEDEEQKTDRRSLLRKDISPGFDNRALLASRKKILEIADFIIPGHGKMFEV